MYKMYEQYNKPQSSNEVFICDDYADIEDIAEAKFGSAAYVIHTKKAYMMDSTGVWYEM